MVVSDTVYPSEKLVAKVKGQATSDFRLEPSVLCLLFHEDECSTSLTEPSNVFLIQNSNQRLPTMIIASHLLIKLQIKLEMGKTKCTYRYSILVIQPKFRFKGNANGY